ncbi:MAG TPA: universal stress protein [Puia sp.]|jgi:nucleotide-binding universal stress UspA family protein|nr:universal stress protein [Puia sp.]
MEKIIVATDFSKTALNAAKYAAALSSELHAQLILVHVIEVPLAPLQVPLTAMEFAEIEKVAAGQLDDLKEHLLFYTKKQIDVRTEIKYGFAETALEALAKEIAPLAVVVGLRGDAPSPNFFMGSTAWRIVPFVQCPVLIIPDKAVFSGIKSIAIASDSQQINENSTIQAIKKWLTAFSVSPDIVHVNTQEDSSMKNITGNIFLYNRFAECSPLFHSIDDKNVEEGIFGFLKQKKPDLLIVVPGKYSFFKKLFHASHSKQLILHSHLPVLAVHALLSHLPKIEKQKEISDSGKRCSGCDGLCCKDKQLSEKQVPQFRLIK